MLFQRSAAINVKSIVLTIFALVDTTKSHAAPSCESLGEKLSTPMMPGRNITRYQAEFEIIVRERTCVRSFPWPPELLADEGKIAALSSDQTREIIQKVDGLMLESPNFDLDGWRRRSGDDAIA